MDINEALKLALPLMAMLVSYGIQKAHFSDKANTTVAGVTVLLATAGSLFLQGKLTGNVYGDIMLVASSSVALQAEAFAPLQQYLRTNFLSRPSQPASSVRPTAQSWPPKSGGDGPEQGA
jgi:hypothetical protein